MDSARDRSYEKEFAHSVLLRFLHMLSLTLLSKSSSPSIHTGGEHVYGTSVMPSNRRLCLQSFEQVVRSVEDRRSAWERVSEASCDVERLLTSRVEQEQQADR